MTPYGHHWRTVTRPAILERDRYRCRSCRRPWRLEVAHLDGDPSNDDPANLRTLCKWCHRTHDLKMWRERAHLTRSSRKDAARPLLVDVA